jgi:hypothetical protein
MALSTSKVKAKTSSSLKEFSLYTSLDDIITPIEPLPVRVGNNTLYASLYPPKTITGDNIYIYTKNKKYRLQKDNTVPIPAAWTNGNVPYGIVGDIAAGNGLFMYVGYGEGLSIQEYRCYTSPDGINWTRKTDPFSPLSNARGPFLAFHHGYFYCTYGNNLVYSSDGNSWTSFTPFGLRAGYVYNMWVNYWNQKYAYYIGEWDYGYNHIGLVGESPNLGNTGQDIFNKGYSGYFDASAFFWGKHFYITGMSSPLGSAWAFLHCDSNNYPQQPTIDSAIVDQLPGIFDSVNRRYYPIAFLPYGNKLFVRYTNSSGSVVVRSTVDGYTFSPDTLPFSTPTAPVSVTLTQGDDVSRRLAIISGENNTFYAYDHMAGNAPVLIFTTSNGIDRVVSNNGIYLAQGRGGATKGANRLWVAYFP